MLPAYTAQSQRIVPILPLGQYLWPMLIKALLIVVLLFGPAYIIAHLVGTRYRKQVLGTLPFLKGNIFQAVTILWLFIASFTYLPALLRFWIGVR